MISSLALLGGFLYTVEMSKRPLVFLDFDDVLCMNNKFTSRQMLAAVQSGNLNEPALWSGLMSLEASENLKNLSDAFSPLFVISSTWATYIERAQLADICNRTGLSFVADNLHDQWATPRALNSSRRDEIEWWLDAHAQAGQPFLVIDDNDSGWSLAMSPLDREGKVVLCQQGRGFMADELERARSILLDQM